MMSHNIVENVVKQGYLKKGNYGTSRLSGLFRRNEVNKWFVLTIRQGVPFLEYYDTDVDVFTHQPINSFNLSTCQNVKSMGNTNPPSFCIVCPERVIELVASSRTQMVEWVNEVEASLTRLGILKNEVVEHVYTVCPAVVGKSRTNKDVGDEKDTEPSLLTVPGTSETRNSGEFVPSGMFDNQGSPAPPLRSPPARQKPSSKKSSTSAPLRSSSSFHVSSQPNSVGNPPPLPIRQPSYTSRTSGQKETVELGASEQRENSSVHPVTESSNDSDFVSPEVIAELRQQCQASKRSSSASVENNTDTSNRSSLVILTDVNTATNKSYFECNLSPNRQSQLQPALKISVSGDFSSSSGLDDDDSVLSPLSAEGLVKSEEVAENDYCEFPCQPGASDSGISSTDENISGGSLISKPRPVPRKALPKVYSSPGNLSSEFESTLNESKNPFVFDGSDQYLTTNETCKNLRADDKHVPNGRDNYDSLCAQLKQQGSDNDYMTFKDGGTAGTVDSSQSSSKQIELYPSKDENENFYGLIYDNGPPTTIAPPPPIPPLPPRHNSVKAKCDDSMSLMVSSSPDVMSSSLPPSAFSAAASSKHRSLPLDAAIVPPLPLPRKSGTNPDSLRKPLQASAFTSNSPLDVPPMLPRRTSPHFSQTLEDQPPALPSRNSQSFFIKRPQITGMSSNMRSCSEDNTNNKTTSPPSAAENHLTASEGKPHETVTATGTSNLSRKMLLDRAHSLHTVVSLKQTQAEILQTEISMPSVTVTITQKAGHGIALVDWNNCPCVVGWNQKDFPSLHGKFHLGDIIVSVNNISVTTAETAQKLLKQISLSKIEVMLHRMPYAKVFAIHRKSEGQSLGIKREGGTGEIVYVDPNGLAAQHGLTGYAQSAAGNGRSNWFLTEINNRPLNLFFKENEIDHRLLAVGREISLVVQPCDFVYDIRRQFKKLKNYKNFITQ